MKRCLSLTAALMLLFSCCLLPALADNASWLTEDYIEQYAIRSTDEFGNVTYLIPLPSPASYTPAEEAGRPSCLVSEEAQHFLLSAHTNEMINLSVTRGLTKSKSLSEYAEAGFIITKGPSKTVTFTMQLDLKGSITKDQVANELGVMVGGTYEYGENTCTSPMIPDGYIGRISYLIKYDQYSFDDKVSYLLNTVPVSYYESIVEGCYAESAPYDGCFCLELRRE